MKNLFGSVVLGLVVSSNAVHAGQRTVTLTVDGMVCEVCPYMVKKTIERVSGVSKVVVSFKDKAAVVTFDDSQTDVASLMGATAKAGFPSAPKG